MENGQPPPRGGNEAVVEVVVAGGASLFCNLHDEGSHLTKDRRAITDMQDYMSHGPQQAEHGEERGPDY